MTRRIALTLGALAISVVAVVGYGVLGSSGRRVFSVDATRNGHLDGSDEPVPLLTPEPLRDAAERRAPASEVTDGPAVRHDDVDWLRNLLPERYGPLSSEDIESLTELDLSGAAITDADLERLAAFPNLQRLSLRSTPITDAGLVHLASLDRLRFVVLRETQITALGIRSLPTENLEALHLCRSRVTGEDLQYLPPMPKLRVLKLNFLDLEDSAVPTLNVFPSLRHLELDQSKISEAGLEAILQLNPHLKRVELRNTPVTEEGAQRLASEYPDCEFVLDAGGLFPHGLVR